MKRITDPDFQYEPSYDTDIRRRFARVREDRKRSQEVREQEEQRKLERIAKAARLVA